VALVSIESWVASPDYEKIYIADTNFLFKSVHLTNVSQDPYAIDDYKLLRDFRKALRSRGCTVLFNSTVRHELLRLLRHLMVKVALQDGEIDGQKISPEIQALRFDTHGVEKTADRFLKDVLRTGYIKFFNDLLGEGGEHLSAEFERVTAGCLYRSYGASLSWSDTEKTMAQYGLDSSDAMIVNAGVKTADCVGLLTADSDFRYCYNVENFDIIMPQRLRFGKKPVSLDPYV